MTVSNFHSFCQRILTENAADAGLPPQPGRARRRRPGAAAQGHPARACASSTTAPTGGSARSSSSSTGPRTSWSRPADFDAFVAEERRVFEERYGSFEAAADRLERQGQPARRCARSAGLRRRPRQRARRGHAARTAPTTPTPPTKTADREARRTIAGDGYAARRAAGSPPTTSPRIDALADTYVVDGAALEVLRLTELAAVYRAYEAELARRGALDFGEQIAAVTTAVQDPAQRPAPLAAPVPLPPGRRVPGRQRRPDRAHRAARPDARPARQRHGRRRRRPVDLPLPRRQLRRLRRVRRALLAAADPRPDAPPPGPPPRLRIEQNFRSVGNVLTAANRLIAQQPDPLRAGQAPRHRAPGRRRRSSSSSAPAPEDEAVAIVDAIKAARRRRAPPALVGRRRPVPQAQAPRRDRRPAARRGHPVHGRRRAVAVRDARDPRPRAGAAGRSPTPHDDVALIRMMTAGPWRLDALEILRVTRMAQFDRRTCSRPSGDRRVRAGRGRRVADGTRTPTTAEVDARPARARSSGGSSAPSTSSTR